MEDYSKDLIETRKALLNILEDVEEARKSSERERDKTKAIISNLADGLLILDRENRIILINSEGEKILDIKAEEIEGKILGSLSEISSIKHLAELISKKKSLFRSELSLEKPNRIVLEVTIIPLTPGEEKIVILHDVSREKLIDRMKSEFVSFSAHQLKTPLATIKWALKMFLDGDLGKITKEQKEIITKTYQTNERMISLVEDLLNLARIEEGRYLYNLVSADIEGLVDSIINSHREEIKKKRIKVTLRKPSKKIPKTLLDVEKIKIAIDNIFDNAIKYTLPGGEVTVYLKYDKKNIEVSIEDTGVGISEKQQGRLFTKFFRGSNVIRMETEGTGLGLFIAKNIIEAHGGKIWFESKEKVGTTFYFSLPIREKIPAGN